jgi:hypothetical protein
MPPYPPRRQRSFVMLEKPCRQTGRQPAGRIRGWASGLAWLRYDKREPLRPKARLDVRGP